MERNKRVVAIELQGTTLHINQGGKLTKIRIE
jgi:hypothetical protein